MLVLNYLHIVGDNLHREHHEDVVKYRNATLSFRFALARDFFHFLLPPFPLESPGPLANDMEMTHFFKIYIFLRDTELPENGKSSIKNWFLIAQINTFCSSRSLECL